jgi:hypothetical protein
MGKERFQLGPAEVAGVAFAVEENKAGDPIEVRAFGVERIMLAAQGLPDLVEAARRRVGIIGGHGS